MKLENPYVIQITGDPQSFLLSARDSRTAIYLLERLFRGEEVDVSELESWGIRVTLVDEFVKVERSE